MYLCRSLKDVRVSFKPLILQFRSKWWILSRKLQIPPEGYLVINVSIYLPPMLFQLDPPDHYKINVRDSYFCRARAMCAWESLMEEKCTTDPLLSLEV